jgi:HD-GYP domain-containing protein (c-di-GMP phosphodiesterase class II)
MGEQMDRPTDHRRRMARFRLRGRTDDQLVERARASTGVAPGRREAIGIAAVTAAFALAVAALWLRGPGGGGHSLATAAALTIAYALAARVRFEVGSGLAVPTQLVFVPMLLLANPAAVPLMVAAGFALSTLPEHLRGDRHPARLLTHVASATYAVGPVLVVWAAGRPEVALAPRTFALLAAALAAQFVLEIAGWLALGHSLRGQARALAAAWEVDLALTPLGLAVAVAGRGHAAAVALVLPLVWLLAEFARQRTESVDQALALSEAYRGTALLLGDVVEADDSYTGFHSRDVVSLVLAVCDRLGLDADSRHLAELTARLHDVGKVEIPKEIIRKPGPLTPDERAVIETHTLVGERMLKQVGGLLEQVGELVRSCHERWDGAGYPDRLAGADIPLVARIVCACDAFSAMTTDRSYRSALSPADAVAELRRCSGTQFDPAVVGALVAVADGGRRTLAPAA